ncbi:MAG TPA: protein kinase [Vicinamibacterales bacterium]|nr:protein kinase [Vicinamibacterales bacterium]
MSLTRGSRLGPYEIVAPIGAGGMGEVYEARDTRLDRTVAIKVLPAHVAADPERRSRFEREARAVAKLSHPNILAIYDVGEADGVRFMVSELVEGVPVSGPLPLRRLLELAVQITDGLAAAHEAGIVHRDIKPDNILITRDGRAKILDFGLAREESQPGGGSGATQTVTSAGTVLGTVAYMSPEQARARPADARSDQFSFGLVLYELVTGRQAFTRDSAAQTLSAIIEADPDLTPLDGLPAPLRWLIERCLAKDPADRYASTADLYRDLRQLRERQSELGQSGRQDVVARPAGRRTRWPLVAAILLGTLAVGVALWPTASSGPRLEDYRFVPFAVDQGVQSMPAWSPDGLSIAFSGEVDGALQLFVRRLDQSTPSQLTALDGDCVYPIWDPDGTRVFFVLVERGYAAFSPEARDIWVVSAAGGQPERLVEEAPAFAIVPGGSALVFLVAGEDDGSFRSFELRQLDLESRAVSDVGRLPGSWNLGYVPVNSAIGFSPDGSQFGVVDGGQELFLLPAPLTAGSEPRRIQFTTERGDAVTLNEFAWMPDGRRVLFNIRDSFGGDQSVWIGDVEARVATRVSASAAWETSPAVAPDGTRFAYGVTALDWDLVEVTLPGGASRPLVISSRYDGWGDWLPDGSGLVFSTQRTGRFEIWEQTFRDGSTRAVVTPDAFPGEPTLFLVQGAVSPDGRSVAYVRYSAGEIRIYVSALAGSRPVRLTGDDDAAREDDPAWSPDGRWILFRRGNRLLKALASGGARPVLLAEDAEDQQGGAGQWLPDGQTVIYRSFDGLKRIPADGGVSEYVSRARPVVWDLAPDGQAVYAVVEREQRAIDLVSIDVATGATRPVRTLGRAPITPDYSGYPDTLRAMRVSPDGTRLMYAYLNPESDIWILEGAGIVAR